MTAMGRVGMMNVEPFISDTDGEINVGAVAGGVVGGIVVIAGIVVLLGAIKIRREKREDQQVLQLENATPYM